MKDIAKGRKVIVCDSDEATLTTFCRHLERMGIAQDNLICTCSIKETLDMARKFNPDIIFMDLHVSEPGYSLCSLLNTANQDLVTPVILMAFPEKGIGPLRGVAMRGRGYITKPVQLLTLQNKLVKIFREVDLERKLSSLDESLSCCSADCREKANG